MGEITAILPAYNEEVSIGIIIPRSLKYAYHEIVVDNGNQNCISKVIAQADAYMLRHKKKIKSRTALEIVLDRRKRGVSPAVRRF